MLPTPEFLAINTVSQVLRLLASTFGFTSVWHGTNNLERDTLQAPFNKSDRKLNNGLYTIVSNNKPSSVALH